MSDGKWNASSNPNSSHQLWSRWTFTIYQGGREQDHSDVKFNAARWLRLGFGSVGRASVKENVITVTTPDGEKHLERVFVIIAEVEGAPANDPSYVANVRQEFLNRFVASGWGPLATGTVTVDIMAGEAGDGKPPRQLLVLPSIRERG